MIKGIGIALGAGILVFFVCLLTTVVGGILGWVVGLVFPFVIVSLNTVLGLSLSSFQMGAVLGFVGGFFRSNQLPVKSTS